MFFKKFGIPPEVKKSTSVDTLRLGRILSRVDAAKAELYSGLPTPLQKDWHTPLYTAPTANVILLCY
jgi:hypothetical protein